MSWQAQQPFFRLIQIGSLRTLTKHERHILILLGSLVEGFGFGLSLGTNWPYTRNILVLLIRGDPEAAHRIVATLVGLIGVALVILAPASLTINGLVRDVQPAAARQPGSCPAGD